MDILDPSLIVAIPLIGFMVKDNVDIRPSTSQINLVILGLLVTAFVVSKKNLNLSTFILVLVMMISNRPQKEGFSPHENAVGMDPAGATSEFLDARGEADDVPPDTTFQYNLMQSVGGDDDADMASRAPGSGAGDMVDDMDMAAVPSAFDWGGSGGGYDQYEEL